MSKSWRRDKFSDFEEGWNNPRDTVKNKYRSKQKRIESALKSKDVDTLLNMEEEDDGID